MKVFSLTCLLSEMTYHPLGNGGGMPPTFLFLRSRLMSVFLDKDLFPWTFE